MLFFSLLALISFSLARLDRSDPVYAWMGGVFLLTFADYLFTGLSSVTQYVDATVTSVLIDAILGPVLFGRWVILWWIWFRLKRPSWVPKAVALLTLGFMVSTLIGENLLYPFVSLPMADLFHTASLVVRLGLLVVLIFGGVLGNSPPGSGGLAGAAGRDLAHHRSIHL